MYTNGFRICFVLIIVFIGLFPLSAGIINVEALTEADLRKAIETAKEDDYVVLPSGTIKIDSELKFTNKITLVGSGSDKTILENITGTELFINLRRTGSRVTGIKFIDLAINIDVSDGFRIDNCIFYSGDAGISNIYIGNNDGIKYRQASGVIDSNLFYNGRIIVLGGSLLDSNTQWTLPLNLGGSENQVFIEDNEFIRTAGTMGNCIDANYGGAYVFRYNTVREDVGCDGAYNLMAHSIQGAHRATRSWEIYGNIIDDTYGNASASPLFLRAGTGFVFLNSITNYPSWHSNVYFDNKRDFNTYDISGTSDGTSCWDGNEEPNGYPARDQIGRGPDKVLWDQAGCGEYTQPLVPAGVFLNRDQNYNEVKVTVRAESAIHIKANRDFYEYISNFTGLAGIGTGTLAERPKTSVPGVMYWSTEQDISKINTYVGKNPQKPISGTLYKYTDSGWVELYTPFTYPHPLRNEENAVGVLAPRGIRIK